MKNMFRIFLVILMTLGMASAMSGTPGTTPDDTGGNDYGVMN